MPNAKESYLEVLSLLKAHLVDERPKGEWLFTSKETCAHFRQFAVASRQQQQAVQPSPTPQRPVAAPLPPQLPAPVEKTNCVISSPKEEVKPEPKKEAPAETKAEPEKPETKIKLEPMPSVEKPELSDIKKIIQDKFPRQIVINNIPPKQKAVQIVVLAFSQDPTEGIFLKNLAAAMTVSYGETRVIAAASIEKQKAWSKLFSSPDIELIIAQDEGIYQYPELTRLHSPDPSNQRLGGKPLIMLSGIPNYFSMPRTKQVLWKEIQSRYGNRENL